MIRGGAAGQLHSFAAQQKTRCRKSFIRGLLLGRPSVLIVPTLGNAFLCHRKPFMRTVSFASPCLRWRWWRRCSLAKAADLICDNCPPEWANGLRC